MHRAFIAAGFFWLAACMTMSPVANATEEHATAAAWNPGTPVGRSCSEEGAFGYASGGITVCRKKRVVFAAPSDIPDAPRGGHARRPDWYPRLQQLMPARTSVTRDCKRKPVRFTSMIVPHDELDTIVPYGGMFTTHVTPTDHAYVGIRAMSIPVAQRTEEDFIPVMSPAGGRVIEIYAGHRITIDHGCGVYSILMVVDRLSGPLAKYAQRVKRSGYVSVDVPVAAGEVVGMQRDHAIDFNVFASGTWLRGLANPYSYAFGEAWKPYTTDPRAYFTVPLGQLFTGMLQRVSEPRIHRIDHDVAGAAVGSWFLAGTIGYSGRRVADVAGSADPTVNTRPLADKACSCWSHLSVTRHWVDPAVWIVSLGSWAAMDGSDADQRMLVIPDGTPAPEEVTEATGTVIYPIVQPVRVDPDGWVPGAPGAPDPIGYRLVPGPGVLGLLALRVNSDGTLTMELDLTHTQVSDFAGFSAAQRTYHR